MRRLLVAGLAALAVVLGLTLSVGTAFAAAPALRNPDCDRVANQTGACAPDAGIHLGVSADVGVGGSTTTTVVPCPVGQHHNHAGVCVPDGVGLPGDGDHHWPGGYPGGGYGGNWHPGLPWGGPSLYGHQLWVEANLGLDICGYGNSYDTFLNRNLRYRSSIDRLLDRNRWQSLYSSDCNSGIAVLPGGLALVNGNLINLDLLGLQGGGLQSVCSYADYNVFSDHFRGRFGNRFDSVRNRFGSNGFNVYRQLQNNARCTTIVMPSSTTIVQAPNTTTYAAPADPSGNDAASAPAPAVAAPLASGPVPSGAVQTGGDSPAWVLAHARAV